nr:lamin tail domain-containing protein [uncultured Actinoplanes sp.]
MKFRLVPQAAVIGAAAAVAMAAPASAATPPTLSGPALRTGYGTIILSGTAAPGASVHLYESAIAWNDLQPADDWEHGGGVVTAKADSTGRYSIRRYLDTGFYFQVESGGERSRRITVHMRVHPTFWVRSPAAGTIEAHTDVSPNEEGLEVAIQQRSSSGSWTTVATGKTNSAGAYAVRLAGIPRGEHTYRASISADPSNGVLANVSEAHHTYVSGSGTTTQPAPAPGSVQFTRIQFDSPGADTGSNTSLNGEWVKLTNKSKKTVGLTGWSIRDASGVVYRFHGSVALKAGASIVVRTGKGTNTAASRYWARAGKAGYVWGNVSDTAYLRNPANSLIDSCKWTSGGGATNC